MRARCNFPLFDIRLNSNFPFLEKSNNVYLTIFTGIVASSSSTDALGRMEDSVNISDNVDLTLDKKAKGNNLI